MTLLLTSTQSIPDSVEEHSTCPSVHGAKFESRRRSLGDRSMCFSSIDGKAPRSPVIKTDCQTAIKVMDLPGATSVSRHRSNKQSVRTYTNAQKSKADISSVLWWSPGSAGSCCYQTRCGRWVIKLRMLSLYTVCLQNRSQCPSNTAFSCGFPLLFTTLSLELFISCLTPWVHLLLKKKLETLEFILRIVFSFSIMRDFDHI